jgi:hypothetical protein
MRSRWRSGLSAVVAVGLLAAGSSAPTEGAGVTIMATPLHLTPNLPAPALTVTPSTGLRAGDTVRVELAGPLPEDMIPIVALCPAAALDEQGGDVVFTPACRQGTWRDTGGVPTEPLVGEIVIADAWAWPEGAISSTHCGRAPGGCVVVAWWSAIQTLATAPVTIEPNPLSVVPDDQEAGFPVHAYVTAAPRASVTLAVCALPSAQGRPGRRCGPQHRATLDARGEAMVPVELVATVRGPRGPGRTVDCTRRAGQCGVVLFDARGRALATVPVIVGVPDGPPQLVLLTPEPLLAGDLTQVMATGARNETLRFGVCGASELAARPAGQRVTEAACEQIETSIVGYWPSDGWYNFIAHAQLHVGEESGTTIACGEARGRCVVALETAADTLITLPFTIVGPDWVASAR